MTPTVCKGLYTGNGRRYGVSSRFVNDSNSLQVLVVVGIISSVALLVSIRQWLQQFASISAKSEIGKGSKFISLDSSMTPTVCKVLAQLNRQVELRSSLDSSMTPTVCKLSVVGGIRHLVRVSIRQWLQQFASQPEFQLFQNYPNPFVSIRQWLQQFASWYQRFGEETAEVSLDSSMTPTVCKMRVGDEVIDHHTVSRFVNDSNSLQEKRRKGGQRWKLSVSIRQWLQQFASNHIWSNCAVRN